MSNNKAIEGIKLVNDTGKETRSLQGRAMDLIRRQSDQGLKREKDTFIRENTNRLEAIHNMLSQKNRSTGEIHEAIIGILSSFKVNHQYLGDATQAYKDSANNYSNALNVYYRIKGNWWLGNKFRASGIIGDKTREQAIRRRYRVTKDVETQRLKFLGQLAARLANI